MSNLYYRVSNIETNQGLWYNFLGEFTGLIHEKFNFCTHKDLAMDYDESIRGYLSVADSLEGLYKWFSKGDILMLQKYNYFIHVYESNDVKFYDKFQHFIINQSSSKLVDRIVLK